ncbi:MAG: hypothetical protein ACLFMX_07010 [Halobacteriales archaeon]
MPLRRPWRSLERETVRTVPDRYGMYELADEAGEIVAIDHGPLRDALKEALAYGDAAKVRYEITPNRRAAERLVADHRTRHEG